jgi:hypothetical protein
MSSPAQTKFITINGIQKRNPQYVSPNGRGSAPPTTTVAHPDQALTIVSSMSDFQQPQQGVIGNGPPGGPAFVPSEAMTSALEIIREPDYTEGIPMSDAVRSQLPAGDEILAVVSKQFEKYETLIGMVRRGTLARGNTR